MSGLVKFTLHTHTHTYIHYLRHGNRQKYMPTCTRHIIILQGISRSALALKGTRYIVTQLGAIVFISLTFINIYGEELIMQSRKSPKMTCGHRYQLVHTYIVVEIHACHINTHRLELMHALTRACSIVKFQEVSRSALALKGTRYIVTQLGAIVLIFHTFVNIYREESIEK